MTGRETRARNAGANACEPVRGTQARPRVSGDRMWQAGWLAAMTRVGELPPKTSAGAIRAFAADEARKARARIDGGAQQ